MFEVGEEGDNFEDKSEYGRNEEEFEDRDDGNDNSTEEVSYYIDNIVTNALQEHQRTKEIAPRKQ